MSQSTAKKAPAKPANAQPTKEAVELVKAKPITMSRFHLLAEKLNNWYIEAELGVTVEQVLDEAFFANISMHLRPGDTITVMPDNMEWKLILHVAGAGPQYAHVVQQAYYNLKPSTPPVRLPSMYKVEFAGSHHKWRVLRDGKMLRDKFETEGLARRYAANHEAAVAR